MPMRVVNPFPLADAPRVWFWVKDIRHRLFDDTVPSEQFAFTGGLVERLSGAIQSWGIYQDNLLVGMVFTEPAQVGSSLLTCLYRPDAGNVAKEGLRQIVGELIAAGPVQCSVFANNKAVISMLSEIGARRAARLYGQLVRDGKPADVDVFVITKESYHASVSIGVSRPDGGKRPRGPVDEPRPDQHEHQHEHQHPDVQP